MAQQNISQLTASYLKSNSSIAQCLARGLINYSALAREICSEHEIEAFDAVLMACRRFKPEKQLLRSQEEKIASLLKTARMVVRTKIVVAQIDKANTLPQALTLQQLVRKERGDFKLIEGEDVITIITNREYLPTLKKTFENNLRRVTTDLVQITHVFSEKLATTPGVCAYLYRLFAEANINIREEMSCWTDLMVVIDEKDAARALELLSA